MLTQLQLTTGHRIGSVQITVHIWSQHTIVPCAVQAQRLTIIVCTAVFVPKTFEPCFQVLV
jgi:hypothetical protein